MYEQDAAYYNLNINISNPIKFDSNYNSDSFFEIRCNLQVKNV